MLALLGFGKKGRSSRKVSRKGSRKVVRKGSRKPPAKVLRMCKKLKVKVTVKRGSKRVYKKTSVLMKQCKKKLRMMKKKARKVGKKVARRLRKGARKSRKGVRKSRKGVRKSRVGSRFRFGASCGASNMAGSHMMPDGKMMFGAYKKNKMMDYGMEFGASRKIKFGRHAVGSPMEFGKKRRSTKKVSKASAMKAFKAFYRRHCQATSRMGRRSRFGNGGNPPLYQSMGYEFCPLGQGGVLGANSTGLFPSPCYARNAAEANAEERVKLGARYGGDAGPLTAREEKAAITKRYTGFGKRRKTSKKVVRRRKPVKKVNSRRPWLKNVKCPRGCRKIE